MCYWLLILTLAVLWRGGHSGYEPDTTEYTSVLYNDTSNSIYLFPDFSNPPPFNADCSLPSGISYFISELNFEAQDGRILVGAANKLYLLNETNLACLSEVEWNATDANIMSCSTDNTGADQASTCQNHIRVYKTVPTITGSPLVLMCGTQASISPQCRTLWITSSDSLQEAQDPVDAADAVVSYYPEFAGFGEFISEDNTAYFGAGFFQGDRGVGRDYQMAFYNVGSPGSGPLSVSQSIATAVRETWLKSPVTFIDYYRADYAQPTVAALQAAGIFGVSPRPDDYKFYFVFIRENTAASSSEVIYSQVVRICRNDPGVSGHFSTYMKARIYCMIEVPPGREYIGANDYIYNNIDSVAFNEEGRYGENADWFKSMYGAFSGPRIGPGGSAICVYPAYNSRESDANAMFNRGIFDIFREDLTMNNIERQNTFVECDPAGRSEADSDWVDIIQDVRQIGNNPLLVLDGITVTQLVVDRVCVVRSSDPSSCRNQDVLFLGTDRGTVIKVVFATVTENNRVTTDPVYAEEIMLKDREEVRALRIETVDTSDKKIFVSTDSQVYQLPIERCSRFQSCSDCVGSRDPYCVWSNTNQQCERTTLSATDNQDGVVDSSDIFQNIHTGLVSGCMTTAECTVTATTLSSTEFKCDVQCNAATTSISWLTNHTSLSTSDCNSGGPLTDDQTCAKFSGGRGLHTYQCRVATTTETATPGPIFKDSATTSPGEPAPVMDEEIFVLCGQRDCEVCFQLTTFTDYFDEYRFTIEHGTAMGSLTTTSATQYLNTGNCLTVTSLTPGSTFYYKVVVANSQGSDESSVLSQQVLEAAPGPVNPPTVTGKTSTTVSLSWSPPAITNGVVTGYAVMVDGTEEISCVLLTTTMYTVDGLSPYTEYRFSVAACTRAGEGTASNEVTERTDCAVPGPVDSITFPSLNSSSIQAQWALPTEVNGDPAALNYEYEFVCYDPFDGQSTSSGSGGSVTISNLDPLSYCCVSVEAYHTTSAGCTTSVRGPAIQACARTMDVTPGAVENLSLRAVSPTTMYATWDPPSNYQRPGLTYTLSLTPGNSNSVSLSDLTSYYLGELVPSTQYTVTVSATAVSGVKGGDESASNSTLNEPPSPPTNLSLTVSTTSQKLTFSWAAPANSPVTGYEASLRCDDIDFDSEDTVGTSVDFDVSSVVGFAWCTAVVQAENSAGKSEHSVQVDAFLPATVPTKPRCFFNGNTGMNASISFSLTHPFALEELRVEWTLSKANRMAVNGTEDFSTVNDNIVYVMVDRDTTFDFELRLCNRIGCGGYCDGITFTTETTTPSPPEIISLMSSDCCSANITWSLPPNEIEGMVLYTLQLTSSCSEGRGIFSDIRTRYYTFSDLCADTEYTVAIKVTELQTNTTGLYGRPLAFNTTLGTPSPPRYLRVSSRLDDGKIEQLTFTWGVPAQPNGIVAQYEIQWSNWELSGTCDEPGDVKVLRDSVEHPITEYTTEDVTDLNVPESVSLLVCVRAKLSDTLASEWVVYQTAQVSTGGLSGGSGETCTNLVIVAVIASLAVLSSIVLGVILVLIVGYNGWTARREKKEKPMDKDIENFAKGKPKVPYNRSESMKPMLGNGTNGRNDSLS